jgi:alkylation response protein AidB-like acyl-CoA dehydrogenase
VDWRDTPEQASFRADVSEFIRTRFPADYRPDTRSEKSLEPEDVPGYNWPADRKSDDEQRRAGAAHWARALQEKRWVAPHWPIEYGGGGLTVMEQFILYEEMARARVPVVGGIGVSMLGPTLIEHGTAEQRREHLPKILTGEIVWAQGFSEPQAGSDLASLKTTAIRDGDDYVVNGQKVWTSHANYADWLFFLARTDPEAPKHKGITFLMTDITTPGITVQPTLDPRGDVPFNEVFLEDVRVPAANRVGEENQGWYVAMTVLDFERGSVGGTVNCQIAMDSLLQFLRSHANTSRNGDMMSVRQEIAERYIEIEVLYNLALRTVSMQAAGEIPNYEASVNQLLSAEVHQRLAQTGQKAFGLYGNILQRDKAPLGAFFAHDYVDSAAHTVLSGTAEIQRNIIARRGLGLPRSD